MSTPPAQQPANMHHIDEEKGFSRALTNFLEKQCIRAADASITDKQLFRYFRAFWMQAPECFDHPALLGQFRVELAQRGFLAASTGKHPCWLGLTLRKQEQAKKKSPVKERQGRHV
jgi:hypothetical protein